jgi:L-alanine-DL-glutamate epimerase-like enolase superfamily enzyme
MKLSVQPFDLKLTTPFRISRHVQYTAANVLARITHEGVTGIGEAAPSEHYGENRGTVLAALELLADELGDDPFAIEETLAHINHVLALNPSAKAALDMALYDLVGKQLNVPVYKLLGLSAARTPLTSFTIGIDTPEVMAQKALDARDYLILKIKVGTKNDVANLKAIREVSRAIIRVDANTAWTPKEAIRAINELAEFNIEFVEQPVVPTDLAGLKYVREHTPLPIITDESSITVEDIPRVAECTDGINIKLMKWRKQSTTAYEMALQAVSAGKENRGSKKSRKKSRLVCNSRVYLTSINFLVCLPSFLSFVSSYRRKTSRFSVGKAPKRCRNSRNALFLVAVSGNSFMFLPLLRLISVTPSE